MDWLHALILGIVQGLAEYLPISSSGHLEICRELLGVDMPSDRILQFDIVVHAATVLSTVVILWRMFSGLCRSFFTLRRDDNFYYVCKLLLSAVPVGIVGVFFKDRVEQFFGNGLLTVGICLCVTALLLCFAQYATARRARGGNERGHEVTWRDSVIIGCAQAVAVLPGLSRSGTTIATGLILGDKKSSVAHFSFLMVIIPILGETLLDLKDILSGEAGEAIPLTSLAIGFVAAFIVGCCACKWMISLVSRGKLIWFALYCVIMGIICIVW